MLYLFDNKYLSLRQKSFKANSPHHQVSKTNFILYTNLHKNIKTLQIHTIPKQSIVKAFTQNRRLKKWAPAKQVPIRNHKTCIFKMNG